MNKNYLTEFKTRILKTFIDAASNNYVYLDIYELSQKVGINFDNNRFVIALQELWYSCHINYLYGYNSLGFNKGKFVQTTDPPKMYITEKGIDFYNEQIGDK